MLSVNRDRFIFSTSNLNAFYLSCLIALTKNSSVVLNPCKEGGHYYLISHLTEKAFHLYHYYVKCRLPSITNLHSFYHSVFSSCFYIFEMTFLQSVKMITKIDFRILNHLCFLLNLSFLPIS